MHNIHTQFESFHLYVCTIGDQRSVYNVHVTSKTDGFSRCRVYHKNNHDGSQNDHRSQSSILVTINTVSSEVTGILYDYMKIL